MTHSTTFPGHQGLAVAGSTTLPGLPLSSAKPVKPKPATHWQELLPIPAPDGHSLAGRWWPWPLLATVLHALVLAAVAYCAVPGMPRPEEPLRTIGVIDLVGLGGGGAAGGDGRESGEAATTTGETTTAPAESAPAKETAQAEAPAPAPTTSLAPVFEKPRETPPPKPQPTPKTRRAMRPQTAPPQTVAASQLSPNETATASTPGVQAGIATEPGTGMGLAGEGPGKGYGQTPGEGGGGLGSGGGSGNGIYEGQFGHGDGPKFRHRTMPHYPDEAKQSGKEGSVSLRLRIDASGVLRDVEVIQHSGVDFVEETIRAIRASTFYPATRHGQPLPCNAVLTIRFKLG